MRVGIFLILLTLLAPFSYAQATSNEDRYDCTPTELSFGVDNAFVRAMTDGSTDGSDEWLVYVPSMCGQTEKHLRHVLELDVKTIE